MARREPVGEFTAVSHHRRLADAEEQQRIAAGTNRAPDGIKKVDGRYAREAEPVRHDPAQTDPEAARLPDL